MDDANPDFSDIQDLTFHDSSERKQHIAALGQWSDQDARYFGSLEGGVGAYGLLESYFQHGPDRDRILPTAIFLRANFAGWLRTSMSTNIQQ